jgi:hypothetical protein
MDHQCLKWMINKTHPHEGATYSIVEFPDGTFGVEVRVPESEPTTVSGLTDRASAQRWITRHQDRVAAGPLERLPFRKRVPPKAP